MAFKRKTHHLLLVCGVIMAACPIISTSRGGALVTVGIAGAAAFFLVISHWFIAARRQEDLSARRMTLALLLLFFVAAISLGYWLGWKQLKPRMAQIVEGFADREEMYERARPMAADFPLFGTGPGTFEPVFQLYRISTETYWPAQLLKQTNLGTIAKGKLADIIVVDGDPLTDMTSLRNIVPLSARQASCSSSGVRSGGRVVSGSRHSLACESVCPGRL